MLCANECVSAHLPHDLVAAAAPPVGLGRRVQVQRMALALERRDLGLESSAESAIDLLRASAAGAVRLGWHLPVNYPLLTYNYPSEGIRG